MTLPEIHPDAIDGRCAVTLLHRQRLGGRLFKVGEVLTIRGVGRVRVAAHLIRTGQGKPADQRTARDVALFLALRGAGEARTSDPPVTTAAVESSHYVSARQNSTKRHLS